MGQRGREMKRLLNLYARLSGSLEEPTVAAAVRRVRFETSGVDKSAGGPPPLEVMTGLAFQPGN